MLPTKKQTQTKFKDQCDICGKFDYLKGCDDKCLCDNCRKTYIPPKEEKQLTIFDVMKEENYDMVRN